MTGKETEPRKQYRITIIAERDDEILGMLEQNRQDHMIQLLQMGFHSINIDIREINE